MIYARYWLIFLNNLVMSLLDNDVIKKTAIEGYGFPNINDMVSLNSAKHYFAFCDYCPEETSYYCWNNMKYFSGIDSNLFYETNLSTNAPIKFSTIIAVISKNKNYWIGKIYLCFKEDYYSVGEKKFIYNKQNRVVNKASIIRENSVEFIISQNKNKFNPWNNKRYTGIELKNYLICRKTLKEVQIQIYRTLKLFKKQLGCLQLLCDMNNPSWEMIQRGLQRIIISPEELYKIYNEIYTP